jgi:hypothetical protein
MRKFPGLHLRGICGFFFQFSHTLLSPTFVIQEPPICLKNPKKF